MAPLGALNYNPSTPFRIAQCSGPRDRRFHGLIDEVYLYDRALSSEEIAALAGPIETCTVYVDVTNTSGIEDGSEAYPFNTIQEGIDAAVSGCSVYVADGTYTGASNKNGREEIDRRSLSVPWR